MMFSIIIPTYNRAKFIEKTIQSVLNQDFQDFEIIIVDDGSTDDTGIIVKKIPDPRIKYFYKVNEERGVARNYGAIRSKGDFVTFLDSDDLLYKNHFSEACKLISKNPEANFFHLGYEVRNSHGQLLRTENSRTGKTLNEYIFTGNHFSCIGVFLRKEVALLFPFNQDRGLTKVEDWDLWIRLSARYNFFYSNAITSCMIDHNERSLYSFNLGNQMYTTELLLLSLRSDEVFMSKYGNYTNYVESEMVSLMALNLVLDKQNKLALSFLIEAIGINHKEIFKRRFLAIIKNLILNLFR